MTYLGVDRLFGKSISGDISLIHRAGGARTHTRRALAMGPNLREPTLHRRISPLVAAVLGGLAACHAEHVRAVSTLPDQAPPPPPATVSRFSVPLDYDFTALLQTVERAVPMTFGSLDSVRMIGTDGRKHYAFVAERSPFTAYAEGNLLHIRATITYSARGFYKPVIGPTIRASCGKGGEQPRIVVDLATPLSLDADWHLASQARLVTVAPMSMDQRDHCDVTLLHVDVTDQIVDAARTALLKQLPAIDRKIGEVNLRDRFVQWWRMLSLPIRVTDGVWLLLGPERLRVGTPTGTGHVLTVPVSLDAHPRIVVSGVAPDVAVNALPPLGHGAAAAGFRVILDGTIDYATASAAITGALVGKTITRAGHTVAVTRVTVTAAEANQLALDVTFIGDANGTLRFTGTPMLDTGRRQISVPDLDFDLASDSQLINTYSWLKSDDLRASFRAKAQVPITPAMDRVRGLLLSGLNRKIGDALTLSATVDSVALRALFITREGLVVRAEASGQAGVVIKPR